MSRTLFATLALLAIPAVTLSGQEPQDDPRPGIAVLELENGGSHGENAEAEDFESLGVGLQQMLLTELAVNSELRIVERRRLNTLMAEQDLRAEGRVDPSTAARIGQLVGARYVVLGSFVDLFGDFHMNARIVDTETSELVPGTAQQVRDRRENIYDLLVELASDITAAVDLPPLPTEVREARMEREIPAEAVTLYSRAQVYEDAGRTEQAITLYRRITEEFPQMEEARQALVQLTG